MSTKDELQKTLDDGVRQLRGNFSKLALAMHLLKIKCIYDELYGTGPGGDRSEQMANSAICFADYIAQTGDIPARTVREFVKQAETITRLIAPELRQLWLGNTLTNNLGMLTRVAMLAHASQEAAIQAFQNGRDAGSAFLRAAESKQAPENKSQRQKPVLPDKTVPLTLREPLPTFSPSGQLEGHTRKISDGIECRFRDGGFAYRVVLSSNRRDYVVVRENLGDASP